MPESMKDLETRTEMAYAEVEGIRFDIAEREQEANTLRLRIVIVAILVVPVLVGVAVFAPWFTVFGPLAALGMLATVCVRSLYWLRNVEVPRLRKRYRRKLTEATEALQAQEDRRQLRLLNPEEYDKVEFLAKTERMKAEAERLKRERKDYEEELWGQAFRNAVKNRNPYSWM